MSRFETLVAANDDCSSGKVYSCCEGRGRCENFDSPFTKRRLYYATMRACESRVMESCTGCYLACKSFTEPRLLS